MKTRLLAATVSMLLLAAITLPAAPPALAQPPQNDDFDSAIVVPELPWTDYRWTGEATSAPDDPVECHNNGSVWYTFTPAEDMVIEANTFGSDYDTTLAAYTGGRGSLTLVPDACNDDFAGLQSRVVFAATGGTSYHFLVGYCCGQGGSGGGNLVFNVDEQQPPMNDNWVNAMLVGELPFSDVNSTEWAGLEPGEPVPGCAWGVVGKTIWYAFTPVDSIAVAARLDYSFNPVMAAYTGSSLADLSEVECRTGGVWLTLQAQAGTTYYFQVAGMWGESGSLTFYLDLPPPPYASFGFSPGDPSAFDTISFWDWSWDPVGSGIASEMWDFGDGATAEGCCPTHRYAADGDYTVGLTVTTYDGRSASASGAISVRTHDVAITRFTVPKSASAGQTRSVVVYVKNTRYPEQVEVQLYKSVVGDWQWVGSQSQFVPVRPGNRTQTFSFNYTFTAEDAALGKVTFRAYAYLQDSRDALPADNEAIALPTKVK